ncbi:hypothetical protein MMB232_02342 [Brevundimonas subvibrioides]|uniref:hypothetical protein n=1 Tax=Brevundimonas subvibrioides TaxID=74313 RepID=UPI0032D5A077
MSRPEEAVVIDLPGGDQLVLYAFAANAADRGTIVRRQPDRRRRWTAKPPGTDGPDAYVSLDHDASGVFADTWQGLRVRLDPDTGAILASTFVK